MADVVTTRQCDLRGAGLRLRADVAGPSESPCVLLLHGGGQTRGSWGAAVDRFAAVGLGVVSLDLRGHGDSEWAADGCYQVEVVADDLDQVLDDLQRPVVIVGASFGGSAGLIAASRRSDLLGLVLVDIVPRSRPEGTGRVRAFMASRPEGFKDLKEAASAVAAYLPHRTAPQLTDGLRRNLRERKGRLHWHWDPRLLQSNRAGNEERVEHLLSEATARVRCPVALVRGLLSDVVDDAGVAHLRDLLPHLEVIELAGAGHTAAADDNHLFTDSVLSFVERVSGRATR